MNPFINEEEAHQYDSDNNSNVNDLAILPNEVPALSQAVADPCEKRIPEPGADDGVETKFPE